MRVFTNIKTLKQVKRILNELELGSLLDGQTDGKVELGTILEKLLDDGKLVEFLQTITKDEKTDFEEMEAKEIGELIQGFFTGISQILPQSLRSIMTGSIQAQLQAKTSS